MVRMDGSRSSALSLGTKSSKKIRLKQSDEGHRSCSYSRRIGKHVDTKSHHEAPQHHRPAWMVSAEMEHHENIQQGVAQLNKWIWLNTNPCTSTSTTKMPSRFIKSILIATYISPLTILIFTFGIAVGHDTILCSTHNLKAFLHHGIIDDAYITQTGKVGRKSQLYSIRQSISRIKHVQNLAHSYSRRNTAE